MPKFTVADEEIVELVEEIRAEWHPRLVPARIGVLMCEEAPQSKGRAKWGEVKRPPEELRTYGQHLDFLLWIARDEWEKFTPEQQRAAIDHLLCHCMVLGGKVSMRDHDFAEFNVVIQRHGLWWPSAESTIDAFQPHFEFMQREGGVEALDPTSFNERDVMEQVDDMLDGEGDGA